MNSVAFPILGSGFWCFPIERAVNIAIDTVVKNLARSERFERIVLVCEDKGLYGCVSKRLKQKI